MKLPASFSLTLVLMIFPVSESSAIAIPADTLAGAKQKEGLTVNVVNNTDYDVEQIILWACDYLDIENITICLGYNRNFSHKEGMLVKHDNMYFLYLKKRLTSVKLIVIHELIHIKQYEAGDLVSINPHIVNYKGYVINLHRVDYLQRPYELEAHSEDSRILRKYFKYKRAMRKIHRDEDELSEINIASVAD